MSTIPVTWLGDGTPPDPNIGKKGDIGVYQNMPYMKTTQKEWMMLMPMSDFKYYEYNITVTKQTTGETVDNTLVIFGLDGTNYWTYQFGSVTFTQFGTPVTSEDFIVTIQSVTSAFPKSSVNFDRAFVGFDDENSVTQIATFISFGTINLEVGNTFTLSLLSSTAFTVRELMTVTGQLTSN